MELLRIGAFAELSRLSPKALRLYDELGLLRPARVDAATGYRWYARDQLDRARVVVWLRRLGMPLARVAAVVDCDGPAAAEAVAAYWSATEADHAGRRELAGYLVDRLNGKGAVMYDVAVRTVPARSLLSVQRHVTVAGLEELGTGLLRRTGDGTVPGLPGIDGAPFCVYYGEVSDDSDGPVEWCRPVPDAEAAGIAARFPDLVLRAEPAHEEAYVRLRMSQLGPTQALMVLESLERWGAANGRTPSGAPRQVFLADLSKAGPDDEVCDLAVPLRPEAAAAAGRGGPRTVPPSTGPGGWE